MGGDLGFQRLALAVCPGELFLAELLLDGAVALGFFLPWLEIAAGVALVTRWMERGGLLILTALTTVFIVASVVAKSRGLDISCGCFGHASKDWSFI